MAFVLINAELGAEDEVAAALGKVDEVKEAHSVYGVYDLIARVEAETMDRLKEVIAQKIRRIGKIRSTLTMVVMEAT